jgi:2-polyprenyl-3-methyl-5-hydroxy-6-metoxy-1,4-benzoquinol methylase
MIFDLAPVVHDSIDTPNRIYKNHGNAPLLALIDSEPRRVLDVGCGAGDNAGLISAKYPGCEIHGVTHSAAEAEIAKLRMKTCWVFDIEKEIPAELTAMKFDAVILSHVLEHLRDPAAILDRFASLVLRGGCVIIAVPNTLSWGMRWQFLRGNFEYRSDGVLDDTHLRFFTFVTADRYLLAKSRKLKLVSKSVTGSVPLWLLRRYLLPKNWSACIDGLGCRIWPNLFGDQVLIKAVAVSLDDVPEFTDPHP